MQYTAYIALRLASFVVGKLPFRAVYALSDVLRFVFHRIAGYRKGVIRQNLERAFPESTPLEIERMLGGVYHNLCDIILETVKGFGVDRRELHRRCRWVNPERLEQYLRAGQSVLVVGGHVASWEWTCFTMAGQVSGNHYVSYKPISNKYIDGYVNRCRSLEGVRMVTMQETASVVRSLHNREPISVFLLADQSPSNVKNAHWIDFFGLKTAFLPGPDVLARRYGYPVLYLDVRRVRRGFYEVHLLELLPGQGALQEESLTRLFVAQLESSIRHAVGDWLWSHRRWKRQRPTAPAQLM
jgi:KDO2-lipid IV(A) lauroyltransferase